MTDGSDRGSCRFHDAHAGRAALRRARRDAWDAWLVCRVTEIPPGLPQIEYSEWSDQWVPRGHVLRCHIEDDEEGKPVLHVDDVELDLEAFGRMLLTFCGFGMRIAFVDEESVNEEPEIGVREPEDKEGR